MAEIESGNSKCKDIDTCAVDESSMHIHSYN